MRSAYSNFTLGTVSFSGIGGFQEKAVSDLLNMGIPLKDVSFSNGIITGSASPLDYYTIAETMRKNGVKLRVRERGGLYFTLARYRYRAGLVAGIIVFVFFTALWQTRIQDIDITGDVSRTQAMDILGECGLELGGKADKLSMSRAEHMLMTRAPDCAWADVSLEGFRLNVHVEKGRAKPLIASSEPCNVVASRSAKIVRQVVRRGYPAKENGSGVSTGELLVSGTVPDGRDHVLLVHAEGEIIGEWNESTEFYVPFSDTVSVPTGKKKTYKYLVLGDDEYPLFWGKASAENSVYSEETSLVRIFNQTTAAKIKTGTYTEYEERQISRSADDAMRELTSQRENYERNFFSECEIVNCALNFFPDENGIRMVAEYTLQGDIAKTVEIEYDNKEPAPIINAPETSSEEQN